MARKIVVFTLKDYWLNRFGGEESEGFFKQKLGEYELWATQCRDIYSKMDKKQFDTFCQSLPNDDTEIHLFLHSKDLTHYNPDLSFRKPLQNGGIFKFPQDIENELLVDKKHVISLVLFNHEKYSPIIKFIDKSFTEEYFTYVLKLFYE